VSIFCSVGEFRVVTGTITIMALGIWSADLLLDRVASVSGQQTLVLGPLSMLGTQIIEGSFTGSTRVRLVGGYGGWRKTIPAKSYNHSAGVKKSTVLGDAASACGEKVSIASDGAVGTAFVRQAAVAARVLEQVGDFWWVRNDGMTVVGPRDTSQIVSAFDVVSAQLAIGQIFVATDAVQDWTPGRTFQTETISRRTLSSVIHHIDKGQVRTEAWVLA
jgi:hypothetical protein